MRYLIVCAILVFLIACGEDSDNSDLAENNEAVEEKDTIDPALLEASTLEPPELETILDTTNIDYYGLSDTRSQRINGFSEFISEFYAALIHKDWAPVQEVTRFPFETRGPMDHDPTNTYGDDHLSEVLDAFFEYEVGVRRDDSEFAGKFKAYIQDDNRALVSEEFARIQNMSFWYENGEWKFYHVYLDYETIEQISGIPHEVKPD